jgi:hypothetical protein
MTSVGLQLGQRWVQNFSRWGAERDAQLDIGDVFRAIASNQVQGDDAAALACLYKAMRADFHASGDKAYPVVDKERLKSYLMRIQGDQLDYAFASYQAKIKGEPREPFQQGIAPSCTLISSAFALEQRDPKALESFVRQDENGYHVQFPGVEKEIHFAALSDTERALHTSGLEAIEKAWGILEGGSEIGAIANAGGTGSERPITALTGNQAKSVLLPNPLMYNYLNAKLQSKKPGAPELPLPALGPILAHLQQALADKALVTTGSWSQPVLKPGIQHAHAYSLVGLDMAAQTVKLRNPHGHGEPGNDGKDDGEFDLPIADWVANFNSVTIELAQPAQA